MQDFDNPADGERVARQLEQIEVLLELAEERVQLLSLLLDSVVHQRVEHARVSAEISIHKRV